VGSPALLKACLDPGSRAQVAAIAHRLEVELGTPARDAEEAHVLATVLSFCDLQAEAVRLPIRAVAENYCAVDGLERDPLFASLRARPEYPAILRQARECRDRFTQSLAR
jgi:hypothetical protein